MTLSSSLFTGVFTVHRPFGPSVSLEWPNGASPFAVVWIQLECVPPKVHVLEAWSSVWCVVTVRQGKL